MNKSIEMKNIKITDLNQFNSLLDLIHDEYFDVDDIIYNKDENLLTIPYRRIYHNGKRKNILDLLIYRREEVDIIRSKLVIKNVTKFTIYDTAEIGTYTFNKTIYKDGNLEIICEPNLSIIMEITEIDIDSNDIEIKGKSRIGTFLFVCDSSTGKIYE